jgi:hypothetical protein
VNEQRFELMELKFLCKILFVKTGKEKMKIAKQEEKEKR